MHPLAIDLIPALGRYLATASCGTIVELGVSEVLTQDRLDGVECEDCRDRLQRMFGKQGFRNGPTAPAPAIGKDGKAAKIAVRPRSPGQTRPWGPSPFAPMEEQIGAGAGRSARWYAERAERWGKQAASAFPEEAEDEPLGDADAQIAAIERATKVPAR